MPSELPRGEFVDAQAGGHRGGSGEAIVLCARGLPAVADLDARSQLPRSGAPEQHEVN